MTRRTFTNLIAVILASVVLALYALTELVAGAVFGQGYPLFVGLPEGGGLSDNKQVTYRGVSVGTIADVDLRGEGVIIELDIDPEARIPVGVDLVVLRQSAVGEQAMDMRPRVAETPSTVYYEEGDEIMPLSIITPSKPEDLLDVAASVFGSVDTDNAAKLISELADTVRGRSGDLQSIMVDSAALSESVGDNGAEYDRLFAASRVVNASLARNRDALAALITDLADGAQLIGEIRGDVDSLLDTVPPVLAQTTSILERGDANLACNLRYLANLNAYIATPEHLEDAAEAIRTQEFFFDAFRVIGPRSFQGDPWVRVEFISEPEPMPNNYEPNRPIPDTLPGGACESVFGPGAGAAFQDNHQLAVPEGRVVRPSNDRRTSFGIEGTVPARSPLASRVLAPLDEAGAGG